MSFSFAFSGDDIEDEGASHEQDQDTLVGGISKYSISDVSHDESPTIEPRRHSIQELLASLPSQISYNTLTIPTPTPTTTTTTTPTDSDHTPSSPDTHHSDSIQVLRRSLFDIRAQLMAEADPETHDDEADTMLAGLENGDLTTGIYEGGFKTWECALDLASLVNTHLLDLNDINQPEHNQGQTQNQDQPQIQTQDWQVIELGAGSAIPSLALLRRAFLATSTTTDTGRHSRRFATTTENTHRTPHAPRFKFTLCDYNEEVLRLCTGPNVLLNYHRLRQRHRHRHRHRHEHEFGGRTFDSEKQQQQQQQQHHHQQEDAEHAVAAEDESRGDRSGSGSGSGPEPSEEGELDLEDLGDTFVAETLQDMQSRHLSFAFLSGGWGHSFLHLIPEPEPEPEPEPDRPVNLLILASETIYSPSSSRIFADTLLGLLRRHPHGRGGTAKAWVAAKKVYFGVGGGVDDFVRDIERRGARTKILLETKDTGVGRVVLEVTI